MDIAYIVGLYRGLSLPLAGTILETATLFCANGYFKRKMYEMGQLSPGADLPLSYVLYAGAGTGFFASWVMTPIELIKCRMQVSGEIGNGGAPQRAYSSSMACLRASLAEGGLPILYRGHVAMLLREVPGTALWFGAYEAFLRFIQPPGTRREDIAPIYVVIAGALGGVAYWGAMFPCDTVKSAMQTYTTTTLQPPAPTNTAATTATSSANGVSFLSQAHTWKTYVPNALQRYLAPIVPRTASFFSTLSDAKIASTASSANSAAKTSSPGFITVFRHMFRTYGVAGLYAGITPTLIRAVPSNAVIFLVYEQAQVLFNRWAGLDQE